MILRQPISTLFPYTTLFRSGFENQKELTKMQLDNQKEIAEMQNETQKEIAGIQSGTSRQNTKDQESLFESHFASWQSRSEERFSRNAETISYAVFCLKNKRPPLRPPGRRRSI